MIPTSPGFWILMALIIIGTFIILSIMASLYRKVGPNQALIVYGLGGTRVYSGYGVVVWPMVQSARELSLELMSFDVLPQQDLTSKEGALVTLGAVAQIKVKSDAGSILTAAEQFLSKSPEEREALIRLILEDHLRGVVGQLTVEDIVKHPETIGRSLRNTCADDLNKMGLEIVSFTVKEIRDKNEYIANMSKPDVARLKSDYHMPGTLGRVTVPIPPNGTGEMAYTQAVPARGTEGQQIAKGTEVVVMRYERGIAYVRPWDHVAEATLGGQRE